MTSRKRVCPLLAHTEAVPPTEVTMRTKVTYHASRIVVWLRETWAEMDYANRRMLELRTGSPLLMPPASRQLDELEALYALPSQEPDPDPE